MSKYVKGFYEVKADRDAFEQFKVLEQKLTFVRGIVQNDMVISHNDLEAVEEEINEIQVRLSGLFEDVLEKAVYKGEK